MPDPATLSRSQALAGCARQQSPQHVAPRGAHHELQRSTCPYRTGSSPGPPPDDNTATQHSVAVTRYPNSYRDLNKTAPCVAESEQTLLSRSDGDDDFLCARDAQPRHRLSPGQPDALTHTLPHPLAH